MLFAFTVVPISCVVVELRKGSRIFDATKKMGDILCFVQCFDETREPRDYACCDGFCGAAAISDRFERSQLQSCRFDIKLDLYRHNITEEEGFYMALYMILRLIRFGLLVGGPPCGLFTFLSSSYHMRSIENPLGDLKKPKVRLSNLLVNNYAVLMLVAFARDVFNCLEQPWRSFMDKLPLLRRVLRLILARKLKTYMKFFGHFMQKPTMLWTDLRSVKGLVKDLKEDNLKLRRALKQGIRKLGRLKRPKHFRSALKFSQTMHVGRKSKVAYYKSKKGHVCGGKDLSASAEYTARFADAIYFAWLDSIKFEYWNCIVDQSPPAFEYYSRLVKSVGLPLENVDEPKQMVQTRFKTKAASSNVYLSSTVVEPASTHTS